MKEKKKEICGMVAGLVIGSVLTVAGFIIIPPLIKKYGDKIYKKSLKTEDLDFDDMGPEILSFNDETKEEE